MPLTFGLTGMDPATETALKAAFEEANARGGNRWRLLPETDADYVVVDMDSMYGPMSWLRLHAAGKHVIGLTSGARTQTDFRLERPFDATAVAVLLAQLDALAPSASDEPAGESEPLIAPAATPSSPRPAEPAAATAATPSAVAASPAGMTPAPQPQDLLPKELPPVRNEDAAPPPEPLAATVPDVPKAVPKREPPSAAAGQRLPPAPTLQPHVPAHIPAADAVATPSPAVPSPAAPQAPSAPTAPRTLAQWLASGRLSGHLRLERNGAPVLIDTVQRHYHGPATLKAIAAHVSDELTQADFQPLDEASWASQRAGMGDAQPLSRLSWYGGLLASHGQLAPGFDPNARYQLLKWPQTEREFPKHFRVATAMMKGPATLPEIAEASGVPLADVTDFLNASLATGFAEPYREPEPDVEPPKSGGLFGRLRGR